MSTFSTTPRFGSDADPQRVPAPHDVLAVACPSCLAHAGTPCRSLGVHPRLEPHLARLLAACPGIDFGPGPGPGRPGPQR